MGDLSSLEGIHLKATETTNRREKYNAIPNEKQEKGGGVRDGKGQEKTRKREKGDGNGSEKI